MTIIFLLLLTFLPGGCASSKKPAPTYRTVEQAEKARAKDKKIAAKRAAKDKKAAQKAFWNAQTKSAQAKVKKSNRERKKEERKRKRKSRKIF